MQTRWNIYHLAEVVILQRLAHLKYSVNVSLMHRTSFATGEELVVWRFQFITVFVRSSL